MKNTIVIGILALLLLTSCTVPSTSSPPSSGTPTRTAGVQFSFAEGVPPSELYINEGSNPNANFEVAVNIYNKGNYPKSDLGSLNGKLYLTGFDPSIIKGGRWNGNNEFNRIQGASDTFPEGGFMQKAFIANEISYPFESKQYPLSLQLTACYYYETHASAIVCIDPDPASPDEKVCKVGDVTIERQDAPVTITNVRQTGNSRETIFTIDIANTGSGSVVREYLSAGGGVVSDDSCLQLGYDDRNVVGLTATIAGFPSGGCTPEGTPSDPIRLYDGRGTVVCKFPLSSEITSAYTTQMSLSLHYGYLESISTEVTLVNTDAN
jgi:hypothetical protein